MEETNDVNQIELLLNIKIFVMRWNLVRQAFFLRSKAPPGVYLHDWLQLKHFYDLIVNKPNHTKRFVIIFFKRLIKSKKNITFLYKSELGRLATQSSRSRRKTRVV